MKVKFPSSCPLRKGRRKEKIICFSNEEKNSKLSGKKILAR